jgi:shikimate kinase
MPLSKSTIRVAEDGCVTLIGMAGAGKSTVGKVLAERLGWAHVDTDHIIESWWGRDLQAISEALGKDRFVEAEEKIVAALRLQRCVISTGGSVVYGPKAVARLKEFGPLVHLDPGFEEVIRRVNLNPNRGLAIAPGQTLEDLYAERIALYEDAADFYVDTHALSPTQCAERIVRWLMEDKG